MTTIDKIKRGLLQFTRFAPFLLLSVDVVSPLLAKHPDYHCIYFYLCSLFGYSLVVNVVLVFLYFFSAYKYCTYTKIAVIGVITINLVNLLTPKEFYSEVYNIYIVFVLVCFGILYADDESN